MLLLVLIILRENHQRTLDVIESVRTDYITSQKTYVTRQVDAVLNQLWYEKNRTEERLRNDIRDRVKQAHTIVESLYYSNQHKPRQEIVELIRQAIDPLRFNDGRGYFFIYTLDGTNVLHPINEDLEGRNLLELQDSKGNYIVRNMLSRIEQNDDGSAFYRWWFVKPGNAEREFEKIGFAKRFSPLNWVIGTGEYIDDVERDTQQRMKEWLEGYRMETNGYFFAVDQHGNNIVRLAKRWSNTSPLMTSTLFNAELKELSLSEAELVSYTSPYWSNAKHDPQKMSYIRRMPDWGWVIGGGVFMAEVEHYIADQITELKAQNVIELTKVLGLCSLLAAILLFLSLILSRYIQRRFKVLHRRIDADFSQLKESKQLLAHQAEHDGFTGLPNRALLEKKILQGIELSRVNQKQLAVMFVDLDNFKKVNDQYGHKIGDALLAGVADRFSHLLRSEDTVARFGGDEFVFCFPLVDGLDHAEYLAERVRHSISGAFSFDGAMITTDCSVGVAMYPSDGDSVDQLISNADIVLYRAKSGHKGKVRFYDERISQQIQYDFLVEDELKQALERSEIEVYYQPQVHPRTGELVSMEALCRWNSQKLGFVSPEKFIALAEQSGLIFALGEYVFRRACLDIKTLQQRGEHVTVSINISPKQVLQRGFVTDVYCIVNELDVDCRLITLEVTENVFMEELDRVKPVFKDLRELGFGISLDDFGTGYSSLSYLNALPITEIKIDRTFVDKMLSSSRSENLVRSIIAIGQSNRILVVAEGVETSEQQIRLHNLGVTRLQGYLFSPPIPFDILQERYFSHQSTDLSDWELEEKVKVP
ncbi:EAL domain-containing protein [Vibrio sp. SM6]|uniref:EAL domain-containing protein n=2 Tax=Vibrio agarilyticus TaxID=2726741 RepID=A0A7X8YH63_9VIBR|nr:cache domain-containing protein [Vibrio agarilyticus]NLS13027.1 EAL domain-containing protein [Vibrio agarilyticus]